MPFGEGNLIIWIHINGKVLAEVGSERGCLVLVEGDELTFASGEYESNRFL